MASDDLQSFGMELLDRGTHGQDALVQFMDHIRSERGAGRITNDDVMAVLEWWAEEINRRRPGSVNHHRLTLGLRPRP